MNRQRHWHRRVSTNFTHFISLNVPLSSVGKTRRNEKTAKKLEENEKNKIKRNQHENFKPYDTVVVRNDSSTQAEGIYQIKKKEKKRTNQQKSLRAKYISEISEESLSVIVWHLPMYTQRILLYKLFHYIQSLHVQYFSYSASKVRCCFSFFPFRFTFVDDSFCSFLDVYHKHTRLRSIL